MNDLIPKIAQPISSIVPSETLAPATAPAATPYFYHKFPSGATMGAADTLDTSGRPLLGYRNPGDAATTTDMTRVDSQFDPTVAQPLTRDQYYNPRAAGLRDELHDALGIKSSEQLDHAIALTVGGSNQTQNLRAIPTAENQAAGQTEGKLAGELKEGKISYLDAQIADAKAKGLPIPWTPPDLKKDEDPWDSIKDSVSSMFSSLANSSPMKKFEAYSGALSKLLLGSDSSQ